MNNNRTEGFPSRSFKKASMSQMETDLTENDLDIFDKKIEEFRNCANGPLTLIFSTVMALLAAAVSKRYSLHWKKVGIVVGLAAYLLSQTRHARRD